MQDPISKYEHILFFINNLTFMRAVENGNVTKSLLNYDVFFGTISKV